MQCWKTKNYFHWKNISSNQLLSKTVAFTKFLSKKCESISENVYKHFFREIAFLLSNFFFEKSIFYFHDPVCAKKSPCWWRHFQQDQLCTCNLAIMLQKYSVCQTLKVLFFQVVFGLVNNYETNKFCFVFLLHSHPLQWNTDKYFSQRGRGVLFWSTWKMRTDVERHCVPITEKSVMEI